jgi:hypothetical protein
MEDEHRLCCRRTGNIDAQPVSRKRCEAASENDRPTPFSILASPMCSPMLAPHQQTSRRHLRPRNGGEVCPHSASPPNK